MVVNMDKRKNWEIGEFRHGAEIEVSETGTIASSATSVEIVPRYLYFFFFFIFATVLYAVTWHAMICLQIF